MSKIKIIMKAAIVASREAIKLLPESQIEYEGDKKAYRDGYLQCLDDMMKAIDKGK